MRLLVGLDGREGGEDALELARELCWETGGEIVVVTVLFGGPLPFELTRLEDEDAREAEQVFEHAQEVVGEVAIETRAYGGASPAKILTNCAESEGFDAIVVGSPHRGAVGKVLVGSIARSLLNGAPCDVFVAPKGYADRRDFALRTIAVAYDGTPEAKAALRKAEEIGLESSATIRVLTVVPPPVLVAVPGGVAGGYLPQGPPEPEGVIEAAVSSIDPRLAAQGQRLDGSPAEKIRETCDAEGVDLLVVGSRGYGPLERVLLGSVSRKLVDDAPCPVLVVARP